MTAQSALLQAQEAAFAAAPSPVQSAVKLASARTGVDFSYLVAKAAQESSFNPDAKAGTSSASGLYQFIDQTWLATLKKHGAEHGYAREAALIERNARGRFEVTDPSARAKIMDLRFDPKAAATMAAEFAADNKAHLEANTRGKVGPTELYLAHFLGAGGATTFLNAMDRHGDQIAAEMMPAAAKANRNVFYDRKTGEARSLNEVYAFFDAKFADHSGEVSIPPSGGVDRSRIDWSAMRAYGDMRSFVPSDRFGVGGTGADILTGDLDIDRLLRALLDEGERSRSRFGEDATGRGGPVNPYTGQLLSSQTLLSLQEL